MTAPRALGYRRVSTEEQADSGAGLAAQTLALEQAADRGGWVLELIPEEAVSAKDMDHRPILLEVLRRLDVGEADILVVSKLDRLSRSVPDFGTILERAKKKGWAVVTLDLGVDTTTPTGELLANIMISVAQWERRIIGQRTKEGLAAKKAEGVRLGRPVGDSVPPAVRTRITTERAAGKTFRAIAAGLDHDKVPTAQGGRKWHPGVVSAILATTSTA